MKPNINLDVFLKPESVAVIGATERPGAWGSMIMEGLMSLEYPGKIYPVNRRAGSIYEIPAFPDIRDIPNPVDLAVVAIPEESIEECVRACGEKGAKGIIIITAGFGEAVEGGRDREEAIAQLAHSYGMRIVGPNVSGMFNRHARFNAAPSPIEYLFPTRLAGVCQGGYAIYDLMASGYAQKMGFGRFVHTGNECDLQVTDFLEHFGNDNEVDAIIMYLETVRDGRRFLEAAKRVSREKPIIVHKAGRGADGARAAHSHTGALASRSGVCEGAFRQANIILSPTMELILPLAHAIIERPAMRGDRVAIITMGGSWGVTLADSLEAEGLKVPELSEPLQNKLRNVGLPRRASAKNPIDIGAAGIGAFSAEKISELGRLALSSGEIDALILHGLGRVGMFEKDSISKMKFFSEFEKDIIKEVSALQEEIGRPVMIGNHFSHLESQAVHDLNEEGIRVYNRLDELAQILSLMYRYWKNKR